MALNRVILTERVGNKLTKAALSAIVTEAVIKALPLTPAEVALEADKYAAYTTQVINSLHGENLLRSAMEANSGNPSAMKYLNKLNDTIKSVVDVATQRIANETASTTDSLEEIVDQSRFTPEEMRTLTAKGKELDTSDVAEVIKDKVVATIKAEKEAYDANAQMKQDIVDTLAETAGEDAPSVESWIDMQLAKNDPRQPISFFSRLQDVCMESLLCTESTDALEDTDNISLESLVNVTINQTLDCYDTKTIPLADALEALTHVCEGLNFSEEEQKNRLACASKKSLIMAIVILTVMETLKTMRLFCPNGDCIRKFVDTPTGLQNGNLNAGHSVSDRIMATIGKAKETARNPMYNGAELSQAFDALNDLRTAVDNISEAVMPNKDSVKKALEDVCCLIEGKMANESTQDTSLLSHDTKLARERNIASLDKMHRIMKRDPETSKIRLCCESAGSTKSQMITAIAMDSTGAELSRLHIGIEMVPALGTVVNELHKCAEFSTCNESASMYELYFTDKCYAVPLIEK